MKEISLIIILLGSVSSLVAQQYQQLDINNVNARINVKGYLFGDPATGLPGFEAPKNSGKHSIFAAHLWLGNASRLAASTYFNDSTDFTNGPLDNLAQTSNVMQTVYDRVWKVTKAEITYHIGVITGTIIDPGYIIPSNIVDWPAHGDVNLGYDWNLAPYVDVNNDNFYEPADGDYPLIKGDMATYVIYNDYSNHKWSGGQPIGVEIHQMAYAFACSVSAAIDNTIFVEYKVINKSANSYPNFYLSAWSDFDIGNYTNEFVACDVDRACFFQFDENGTDTNITGALGYGDYHPTVGTVILSGPWMDNDGNDNPVSENPNGLGFGDGVIDNERLGMTSFMYQATAGGTWRNLPTTDSQIHNMMDAIWIDSTNLNYGNTGHIPWVSPGNIRARFVYPGTSDPTGYGTSGNTQLAWDEDDNTLLANDNRGMGSMGPITLQPGAINTIELAYVFAQDVNTTGVQAGKNLFIQYVDEIKMLYTNGNLGCGTTTNINSLAIVDKIVVYPNPAHNKLFIKINEQEKIATIKLYSITGKLIKEFSNQNNTLDISKISNGIYFLEITTNNKKTIQKIIKN